jgi:hypothetical protein
MKERIRFFMRISLYNWRLGGLMQRALAWIQILSAMGVLVGVILVVLQLQQNQELLRFQIATDLRISRSADLNVVRGETYSETLAKLPGGTQALTDAELHQFDAHANSVYNELSHRRMLFGEGIFIGDWKTWLFQESCLLFDNPTGQVWLEWTSSRSEGENEIIEEFHRRTEICDDSFVGFVREGVQ